MLYKDGSVRINYHDLASNAVQYANTPPATGGLNATVGIWKGSTDMVTVAAVA